MSRKDAKVQPQMDHLVAVMKKIGPAKEQYRREIIVRIRLFWFLANKMILLPRHYSRTKFSGLSRSPKMKGITQADIRPADRIRKISK